jgi:hypothetical protein
MKWVLAYENEGNLSGVYRPNVVSVIILVMATCSLKPVQCSAQGYSSWRSEILQIRIRLLVAESKLPCILQISNQIARILCSQLQ